jgi:hypothetical protein
VYYSLASSSKTLPSMDVEELVDYDLQKERLG